MTYIQYCTYKKIICELLKNNVAKEICERVHDIPPEPKCKSDVLIYEYGTILKCRK